MKKRTTLFIGVTMLCLIASMFYTPSPKPAPSVCVVSSEPPMPVEAYSPTDWDIFIEAMIQVESGGNPFALGTQNDVGVLQIRPIMVREANRILGREVFLLDDRYSREISILIFNTVQRRHNPRKDFREACRIWNSGGGLAYYNKVLSEYYSLMNNL